MDLGLAASPFIKNNMFFLICQVCAHFFLYKPSLSHNLAPPRANPGVPGFRAQPSIALRQPARAGPSTPMQVGPNACKVLFPRQKMEATLLCKRLSLFFLGSCFCILILFWNNFYYLFFIIFDEFILFFHKIITKVLVKIF